MANLLSTVFEELYADRFDLVDFLPDGAVRGNLYDKVEFVRKVAGRQLRGKTAWICFDHVGLARVQLLVPRRFRQPYAVFLHGVEAWNDLGAGRKRVLRSAAVRITNSNHTARRIGLRHPDIGPVDVCHLALAPAQNGKSAGRCDYELVSRVRKDAVLIVGRMAGSERYKGHDQLIEAWPLLSHSRPGAQLVIVGQGDDAERLKRKARDQRCEDSILFTGHVNESTLAEIYTRAAVFAMPSREEGFGLVYLEAMSYGLPCIASSYGAAGEIIEEGATGLLIDPDDRHALACAILALLSDEERRNAMGQAGQERVRKEFSFENFKSRITSLLQPVLSDPQVSFVDAPG